MVNVIILLGRPVEQEEFDQHLIDTHMPLVRSIPNLKSVTINQVAGTAQGDAPYYLISELGFASEAAMQEGLNSDEGQAMAKDMSNFASGGVTVLFAHATNEEFGKPSGTA